MKDSAYQSWDEGMGSADKLARKSVQRAGSVFRYSIAAAIVWTAVACVPPANAQTAEWVPPTEGYLFLNGLYVPPPYDVAWTQDVLTINGREYSANSFDLSHYEAETARDGHGMRGRRGMQFGPRDGMDRGVRSASFRRGSFPRGPRQERSAFNSLCEDVDGVRWGYIIVLYDQLEPLCLHLPDGGHEFLQSLLDPSQSVDADPIWVDHRGGREAWDKLLAEVNLTPDLALRARQEVDRVKAAESDSNEIAEGVHWTAKISYPLTIFAMAVVVLGFGHLLSNKPKPEGDQVDHAKGRKVVGQSLLIIGLLSAVDLIWTIGSAHAGLMRELNPLGSGMINEPIQLFLFKATLTAASIGILYSLHRRPIAQMASWWCCLLLTLLTARWVVFQSMFL